MSIQIAKRFRSRGALLRLSLFMLIGILVPTHFVHAVAFPLIPLLLVGGGGVFTYFFPDEVTKLALEGLTHLLVWLAGAANSFMTMLGLLFDFIIEYTVRQNILQELVITGGAIYEGWELFRDLSNIVLIFIFLAIGIGTMLQIEGYGIRKLLPKLIVVALLINFSLFLTILVVDASNLLTIPFYDRVSGFAETPDTPTPASSGASGISFTIANGLELDSLYQRSIAGESVERGDGAVAIASLFIIIFSLITAWVFLNVVFLFAGRFIAFMFLMVLAPIAFTLIILPKTKQYFDMWLETLIRQALVAPIFLILLTIIIGIIQSEALTNSITGINPNFNAAGLFNFVIIIGLLLAALKITKEASKKIGETSISYGKSLTGFAIGAAAGPGGAVMRTAVPGAMSAGRGVARVVGNATGWAMGSTARGRRFATKYGPRAAKVGSGIAKASSAVGVTRVVKGAVKAAEEGSYDIRRAKVPWVDKDTVLGKTLGEFSKDQLGIDAGKPIRSAKEIVREKTKAEEEELKTAKRQQAATDSVKLSKALGSVTTQDEADKIVKGIDKGQFKLLDPEIFASNAFAARALEVEQIKNLHEGGRLNNSQRARIRHHIITAPLGPGFTTAAAHDYMATGPGSILF